MRRAKKEKFIWGSIRASKYWSSQMPPHPWKQAQADHFGGPQLDDALKRFITIKERIAEAVMILCKNPYIFQCSRSQSLELRLEGVVMGGQQCNMIKWFRKREQGQVLPPLALRIPRGLHLQTIAMEEEDNRMVVGLAHRKNSNILLQSFQSPSTTGWARRGAIGPRHQKEFDWSDQRKKACPLIALLKEYQLRKRSHWPTWLRRATNGYIAKSHQRYLEKGFIAYSLPSGWEQMQSLQKKGIIACCLP